jgi:tRNA threonylcarbamoyladenosine biosynthesis protein TsaB
MNLLAIDTSTDQATVAIVAHGEWFTEELGSMRQHAQNLLPMIQRLLSNSGITFRQLDGIVFGRGPGSFTGLRIACSVAKGLAYAHDLPLFPVSGLAAIAEGVYQTEPGTQNVLAMIDARMHQVYWGAFDGVSFSVQEHVSSAADIVLELNQTIILAGVGLDAYVDQLDEVLRERIVEQRTVFPMATAMIRLVQQGYCPAVSVGDALPVYVRNQVTHEVKKGACGG